MESRKIKNSQFDKIVKQLIDKYGYKQLVVAVEELSELQKELCKEMRGIGNKYNVLEEVADVEIMLEQIKIYFDLKDEEVEREIDKKIQRTIERCGLEDERKCGTK